MRKLGFLGAMNRDVVVQQAALRTLPALGIDAPPLVETAVSDVVAQHGAEMLAGNGGQTWLGGSAFNTARVVALLNQDRSHELTFFGIAGSIAGTRPHLDALEAWSVSTSSVALSSLPPATCLALVEPSGRTLLTALGANVGIAAWLVSNRNQLVTDIAACDIVHVTSFLDASTPALVASILAAARALNPALLVSLDPGMGWIAPGGEGLAALMRQTHILHLNTEEFALLGGPDAMKAIGRGLAPGWLAVTRTHAAATIYSKDATLALPVQPIGADFTAVDATGAGDTFCGGFLWSYANDATQPLQAAGLGFALARHKVGLHGPLTEAEADRALKKWKDW
jgi:sugar/nucleoside kinase (ribokinase family)